MPEKTNDADADILAGRVKSFDTVEEMIESLKEPVKPSPEDMAVDLEALLEEHRPNPVVYKWSDRTCTCCSCLVRRRAIYAEHRCRELEDFIRLLVDGPDPEAVEAALKEYREGKYESAEEIYQRLATLPAADEEKEQR